MSQLQKQSLLVSQACAQSTQYWHCDDAQLYAVHESQQNLLVPGTPITAMPSTKDI